MSRDSPSLPPRRTDWRTVIVAAAAATIVAGIGAAATDLGPWYRGLQQPPWKPPDPWFGPAWTLIFGSIAWAGVRLWCRSEPGAQRQRIIRAFSLNGVLNILWSWLFFRAQSPALALAELALLWLSILLLIRIARRIDRMAALLLVPYLAWVSFAATINAAVIRLNPAP